MTRPTKIKRNDPCPCYSGAKFKNCCDGKVDWETIIQRKRDYRPYLSIRGRNLAFVKSICDALQIDAPGEVRDLKEFKAAFTADAVRKIHEALLHVWPPNIDIVSALKNRTDDVSGLYIGDYSFDYVTRAIVRHSIYANRILLIDPFVYPKAVKDEFNPILNPEQYRAQTLKNVNLWFALLPWIVSGIVAFIRPPADFDARLNWDIMKAQLKKFDENEELKKASRETVDELSTRHTERLKEEHLLLSAPDEYLRRKFHALGMGDAKFGVEQFLAAVQEKRDQNPDFLEPIGPRSEGQIGMITSGASYPSATMTANITGSYLFTDMYVRWREIEMDRDSHSVQNKVWAAFAKALHNAPLRYLNSIELNHALTLREEGRLESLRGFLVKVWKDAREGDQFDSANAIHLAKELGDRVRAAEVEWNKIDSDLLKMVKGPALAVLLAAGPLIASGHAGFLAAAVAIAGGLPVLDSTRERRSFQDRFPAAFFMKIDGNKP